MLQALQAPSCSAPDTAPPLCSCSNPGHILRSCCSSILTWGWRWGQADLRGPAFTEHAAPGSPAIHPPAAAQGSHHPLMSAPGWHLCTCRDAVAAPRLSPPSQPQDTVTSLGDSQAEHQPLSEWKVILNQQLKGREEPPDGVSELGCAAGRDGGCRARPPLIHL